MLFRSSVEGQQAAVGEGHGARPEVEPHRAHPEPQLEVELVVGLLAEHDPVVVPLAGEQFLRQRRPVVGQVRLGPDERQVPAEPLTAQGLHRPQAREGRPDHDDAVHRLTPRR